MKEAIADHNFCNTREDGLRFYPLEGLLLADQALSVNTDYLVVSLISRNTGNRNPLLQQITLNELQMRLLLPLVETPRYCPHEVLYTSLYCSYQALLTGFFSSNTSTKMMWQTLVEENRLRMQRAHELGTWKKELKQLYNALSKLRPKLRLLGLDIAVSISGSAYTLISLPRSCRVAVYKDQG